MQQKPITIQDVRDIYINKCGSKPRLCAEQLKTNNPHLYGTTDTDRLASKVVNTISTAAVKLKRNAKDKTEYMQKLFNPPEDKAEKLASQLPPKQAEIAMKITEKNKEGCV